MALTAPTPSASSASSGHALRFGQAIAAESDAAPQWSVRWQLERSRSLDRHRLLLCFFGVCLLSLTVGAGFWSAGAPMVLPFAGVELVALGIAMWVYSRHAADRESIRLHAGRLVVEYESARRVERVEFTPAWVRVEPEHGDRSLIELSGQGRSITVGRFVRPELRRELAEELRWALRRWSHGADGSV